LKIFDFYQNSRKNETFIIYKKSFCAAFENLCVKTDENLTNKDKISNSYFGKNLS
jgi:hypothetical protein